MFNAYFVAAVAGKAPWATFAWTAALSASYLAVLLTAPVVGAWADAHAAKKRLLLAATAGCVLFTGLLYFAAPGAVALAIILVALSNFFFATGENLIAAFLPELADSRAMGRVSGWGWAFGYVGGIVSLGISLAYITAAQQRGQRHDVHEQHPRERRGQQEGQAHPHPAVQEPGDRPGGRPPPPGSVAPWPASARDPRPLAAHHHRPHGGDGQQDHGHRDERGVRALRQEQVRDPFDVRDHATPLRHHARHAVEATVKQHELGHRPSGRRSGAHRHPDVGGLERERVVDPVAGHRDHGTGRLQRADEAELLGRHDARVDLHVPHGLRELTDIRRSGDDASSTRAIEEVHDLLSDFRLLETQHHRRHAFHRGSSVDARGEGARTVPSACGGEPSPAWGIQGVRERSAILRPLPPRGGSGSPEPPSSSGLGCRPFKAETRVRIPLGARNHEHGT